MPHTALVVGASGIVGATLARHIADQGWVVHGLARRPRTDIDGVIPLAADLLQPGALHSAVAHVRPTHVFFSTWMRQATEAENCAVNGALVRNLLGALADVPLQHVALVTGLKHYLGPFESYGQGALPPTPFREEQGRLPVLNFYYVQEDAVFEAADKRGFGWSVHRPHTIIGYALGNAMNMGVTLAVYASLCRELGRPFLFPGSAAQWNGLTDMTDARLLARHLEWASTCAAGRNQDFNVVNGDIFRWNWMWQRLAEYFGVEPAPYPDQPAPLETQMQHDAEAWSQIAARRGLVEPVLDRLVSPWHTDADLGRPFEVVTDMSKSRRLGFLDYQPTLDSFFDLFTTLKANRVIP
ncbi:SDR family oxidoreductase [Lichenicoccus sp.]|uniref:SDR family oxidoreductase n=1 Tax=Lichenicoccus sp. TaxID=2781899 RepID=UPI003D10EABC